MKQRDHDMSCRAISGKAGASACLYCAGAIVKLALTFQCMSTCGQDQAPLSVAYHHHAFKLTIQHRQFMRPDQSTSQST